MRVRAHKLYSKCISSLDLLMQPRVQLGDITKQLGDFFFAISGERESVWYGEVVK